MAAAISWRATTKAHAKIILGYTPARSNISPSPGVPGEGTRARKSMDITVVLPIHNERENLDPLLSEIHAALRDAPNGYEIIAVDDASSDGSADLLRELAA